MINPVLPAVLTTNHFFVRSTIPSGFIRENLTPSWETSTIGMNMTKQINKWGFSAAILTATLQSAVAQSAWEAVDDFQYPPGFAAAPSEIRIAPDNSIFVAGSSLSAGGLVRVSPDQGATWSEPYVFQYVNGQRTEFRSLAAGDSGIVLVVGFGNDAAGVPHWIAQLSVDSGATWSAVDDFQTASGLRAMAYSCAVDAQGNLYAAGWATVQTRNRTADHWLVRRSNINSPYAWTTVDDFSGGSEADGIVVCPAGVFAAGYGNSQTWVVRKSSTGAAGSWSTVDNFVVQKGGGAKAWGIGAGPAGSLFVTGHSEEKTGAASVAHWITRRSTNGGSTWTTVDDFLYSSNPAGGWGSAGYAVAAGANGEIYVIGRGIAPLVNNVFNGNDQKLITRRSLGEGNAGSWSTDDVFQYAPGQWSSGQGIAIDSTGKVFSCGGCVDAGGVSHWVVRSTL
jgi:hypothetical protein